MTRFNVEVLKALANEKRAQIIYCLSQQERNVTELERIIKISQSALSQHLAILRHQRIVSTRREAQTIFYSLRSPKALSIINQVKLCPSY